MAFISLLLTALAGLDRLPRCCRGRQPRFGGLAIHLRSVALSLLVGIGSKRMPGRRWRMLIGS